MKKTRISYLDITRAFAIIFIALQHTLGHSEHVKTFTGFLISFHVPLFFVISGYLFHVNKKFWDFLKSKFMRIMVPYFVWALLFLIPYYLLGAGVGETLDKQLPTFNLGTSLLNILYGIGPNQALQQNNSLWFLPALFTMNVAFYFVIKLVQKYPKIKLPFLVVTAGIGYAATFLPAYLPWGINSVLGLGFFFYAGYLIKDYHLFESREESGKPLLIRPFVILPICIIGILAFYFNKDYLMSYMSYAYGYYFLMLLSGLCLSIVTIYISYLIQSNRVLECVGRNTMSILIFHKLIILVFQSKLGPISRWLTDSNFFVELGLGMIVVALSICFCLIASVVIKKIMPILIGESKRK